MRGQHARVLVPLQGRHALALRDVPDLDRVVRADACERPVPQDGQGLVVARVAVEGCDLNLFMFVL